jgi:hypothetical protein
LNGDHTYQQRLPFRFGYDYVRGGRPLIPTTSLNADPHVTQTRATRWPRGSRHILCPAATESDRRVPGDGFLERTGVVQKTCPRLI